MHRHDGWWYDRQVPRYFKIDDHAQAAASDPKRYRLKPHQVLNPVSQREPLIIAVTKHGFIRVRYTTGNLGWQFWGDPEAAYQVLLRFLRRHEVGDYVEVAFTELAWKPPQNVRGIARDFKRFKTDLTVLPLLNNLLNGWSTRNVSVS